MCVKHKKDFKAKLFPSLSYNPCTPHWLCLGAVTGFWSRSGIPMVTHVLTWSGSHLPWKSGACDCKTWCFYICTLFTFKCEILRGIQTLYSDYKVSKKNEWSLFFFPDKLFIYMPLIIHGEKLANAVAGSELSKCWFLLSIFAKSRNRWLLELAAWLFLCSYGSFILSVVWQKLRELPKFEIIVLPY